MKRECAWCRKHMGYTGFILVVFFRWIFRRLKTTHGICQECEEAALEDFWREKQQQDAATKPP